VIDPRRCTELNDAPERNGDYVLYWMQQSQRAAFNPALEAAIAAANRLDLPVLVGFGLTESYPEANARTMRLCLRASLKLSDLSGRADWVL
jgi:deoxyribodipyrimidine photo-lyase